MTTGRFPGTGRLAAALGLSVALPGALPAALAASLALALALPACSQPPAPPPAPRAEVRMEGGQLTVVPSPGQLPLCLVLEVRGSYSVRPVAASPEGQSLPCDAGKPAGSRYFTLSTSDEPFQLYVVFSDREIKADTVAQQIRDRLSEGPSAKVTSMDLRAPGQAALEILDVRPAALRGSVTSSSPRP